MRLKLFKSLKKNWRFHSGYTSQTFRQSQQIFSFSLGRRKYGMSFESELFYECLQPTGNRPAAEQETADLTFTRHASEAQATN